MRLSTVVIVVTLFLVSASNTPRARAEAILLTDMRRVSVQGYADVWGFGSDNFANSHTAAPAFSLFDKTAGGSAYAEDPDSGARASAGARFKQESSVRSDQMQMETLGSAGAFSGPDDRGYATGESRFEVGFRLPTAQAYEFTGQGELGGDNILFETLYVRLIRREPNGTQVAIHDFVGSSRDPRLVFNQAGWLPAGDYALESMLSFDVGTGFVPQSNASGDLKFKLRLIPDAQTNCLAPLLFGSLGVAFLRSRRAHRPGGTAQPH